MRNDEIVKVIIKKYMFYTLEELSKDTVQNDIELVAMFYGKAQGMIELLPNILVSDFPNEKPEVIANSLKYIDRFCSHCLFKKIAENNDFDFILGILNESKKK